MCVCVCAFAIFDLLDFFDSDGVLCVVFVCACVCVRATFDLQDYFDAEGVLCICVSVCACHILTA